MRRLYRSRTDRMVAGVCGGLAEHFGIDATLVRLLWVFFALLGGGGALLYLLAWIVVPEPQPGTAEPAAGEAWAPPSATTPSEGAPAPNPATMRSLGIILIVVGAFLLLERVFRFFDWQKFWPAVLIVAGVVLIVRRQRPE